MHILDPLDEFVATARAFAFLGRGRCACEDEYRYPSLGGVMYRPGEGLSTALDMNDDGLGAFGYLSEAMRGTQSHHLVGTGDDSRDETAQGPALRQAFHEARMVAPEIDEQMRDAGFPQRLEQVITCRERATQL